MTRFFTSRIFIARTVFAVGICCLVSCQPPAPANVGEGATRGKPLDTGPGIASFTRDLSQDEAAGGHILRKHVGQTDDQLRERLQRERNITGASTYTDRAAAEQAVGAAIAESQDRIQRWMDRSGGHPNLVLDYDSESPIGRTINRGETESRPCAHALVVLKYAGPGNYYVLTSYPECR
jgi:hypothetical protein